MYKRQGLTSGESRLRGDFSPGPPATELFTHRRVVGGCAADQVTLGDDSEHPLLVVEDRQPADVVLSEQLGDILERG